MFYKHTSLDIDALLADEQSTVTEARQNEAQNTVTEPKAQAPPQYSIESLPDGKKYVRADRQVIFGKDPDAWSEQLESYITAKSEGSRMCRLLRMTVMFYCLPKRQRKKFLLSIRMAEHPAKKISLAKSVPELI